jgi:hypothetical protein
VNFLVRGIPDELWLQVKRRAYAEGHTLRFIVLKLLEFYARHGMPPVRARR